jgi:hypothetical protein
MCFQHNSTKCRVLEFTSIWFYRSWLLSVEFWRKKVSVILRKQACIHETERGHLRRSAWKVLLEWMRAKCLFEIENTQEKQITFLTHLRLFFWIKAVITFVQLFVDITQGNILVIKPFFLYPQQIVDVCRVCFTISVETLRHLLDTMKCLIDSRNLSPFFC